MVTNFLHWRTNYLLTFIATLLIAFLTSPLLLLMLLLSTLLSVQSPFDPRALQSPHTHTHTHTHTHVFFTSLPSSHTVPDQRSPSLTTVRLRSQVYLIAVHKGPIVLGSVKVEADKKALLCGAVSLVLLLLSGQLLQLLGALFLGLLLPIAHMVFRKRSVHSK